MALRNKLLIVQTGAPPAEIEAEHGDLPQWFGRLLLSGGLLHILRL